MSNKFILSAFVGLALIVGVVSIGSVTKNEVQKVITAELDKNILKTEQANDDIKIKYDNVECTGLFGETCYINNIVISNPDNNKENLTIGKVTIDNTSDFKVASEMKAGTKSNIGIKVSQIKFSDSLYKEIGNNLKPLIESFELVTENKMSYGENKSIAKSDTVVSMSAQPGSASFSINLEGLYPEHLDKMKKEIVVNSFSTNIKANDWLKTLYTYGYVPDGEKLGWNKVNRKIDKNNNDKLSLNDFRTAFQNNLLPKTNQKLDKEISRAKSELQKNTLGIVKNIINGKTDTIALSVKNKDKKKVFEIMMNIMMLDNEDAIFKYIDTAFTVSVK